MKMMWMWIDMMWQRMIIIDDHDDDLTMVKDEENDHDNDYDHDHDHNHEYDHAHEHNFDHDYSDLFCTDTFKGQKKILYNHGLSKINFWFQT